MEEVQDEASLWIRKKGKPDEALLRSLHQGRLNMSHAGWNRGGGEVGTAELAGMEPMRYYPLCLDISGRKCLVAGGGKVGERKAKMLFRCGAQVTVVSPLFAEGIIAFARLHSLTLREKTYETSDMEGAFLVIAATGNRALNRSIREDARRFNILCNIADQPEESDFILPSVVNRGDLSVAISTSGKSPALAKKLKEEVDRIIGWEYGIGVTLLGRLRQRLLSESHDPDGHKAVFDALLQQGLIELIREGNRERIERVLYQATGTAYRLEELIPEAELTPEKKKGERSSMGETDKEREPS